MDGVAALEQRRRTAGIEALAIVTDLDFDAVFLARMDGDRDAAPAPPAAMSLAELEERMGIASSDIDVVSDPLVRTPAAVRDVGPFNLTAHPLALLKSAEVSRWQAKRGLSGCAFRRVSLPANDQSDNRQSEHR